MLTAEQQQARLNLTILENHLHNQYGITLTYRRLTTGQLCLLYQSSKAAVSAEISVKTELIERVLNIIEFVSFDQLSHHPIDDKEINQLHVWDTMRSYLQTIADSDLKEELRERIKAIPNSTQKLKESIESHQKWLKQLESC